MIQYASIVRHNAFNKKRIFTIFRIENILRICKQTFLAIRYLDCNTTRSFFAQKIRLVCTKTQANIHKGTKTVELIMRAVRPCDAHVPCVY